MFRIIDRAQELWPRSTDVEIGLLKTIFAGDVNEDKAIDILDNARIDSKYNTIPFSLIKEQARLAVRTQDSLYTDCWAVHDVTGKWHECMIVAKSEEAASYRMRKYLETTCKVEPSEYTIFIGEENLYNMHNYRIKKADEYQRNQST